MGQNSKIFGKKAEKIGKKSGKKSKITPKKLSSQLGIEPIEELKNFEEIFLFYLVHLRTPLPVNL